jgi:ribosomal protein S18 acetylase RimI-like enzyme
MDLSVIKCTLDDLDTLTDLSRVTFVDAFKKYNDPADFNDYMKEAFSKESVKAHLLNPKSAFYVCYLGPTLVGYMKLNLGDAQNEQLDEPAMELERIYVVNTHQGKQIGKQMLLKAVVIAKDRGLKFLWLGVWDKNEAAIRFYERHGFETFGIHPYFIGKDEQTDLLMKLDLI